MNGNFLTDFSESRTRPDSVPSSLGALFTLILFRKLWGGGLGAVSHPLGMCQAAPWVCLCALTWPWAGPVASRDEHLLPGEPFAVAG